MARNLTVGAERNRRGAIIPINGVVREVPIGPHTVARFYVQPEREVGFRCALCRDDESYCQGHGPKLRVVVDYAIGEETKWTKLGTFLINRTRG